MPGSAEGQPHAARRARRGRRDYPPRIAGRAREIDRSGSLSGRRRRDDRSCAADRGTATGRPKVTGRTKDMFAGFETREIETSGARIHLRHGGKGPPLLLLHGNPLTHVSWHKMVETLAQRF